MAQLDTLKLLLGEPDVDDAVLEFYLDSAKDIICEIRHADYVETRFLNLQTRIAVELYNKAGAEGQTAHTENGMQRVYERGDVSPSLLAKIPPFAYTPNAPIRTITP
jgi:hypothetical protein